MTGSTTQVDETTLSKKDNVSAVGHEETIYLGFDVLDGLGIGLQPGNIDLNIKMADI